MGFVLTVAIVYRDTAIVKAKKVVDSKLFVINYRGMRTKSVKTGHENTKYTHFVVAAGRIFSGWEFAEDAKDDVANARAVTTVGAKVYTRRGLGTVGLDASKPECWYRAGVA